jgi:serralysin
MNVNGTNGDDTLVGLDTEHNVIQGKGGDDTLVAYGLTDTMWGGAGNDTFEFGSASGIDIIGDFKAGELIRINSIGVGAEPVGSVEPKFAFREGGAGAADNGKPTVIYNPNNGKLFYDYDGDGGGSAKHLAYIPAGLDLHKSDFDVF